MDSIKIVSRDSNLAVIQVNELMKRVDIEWELLALSSLGDKNKEISLLDNPVKDIFTREIDRTILEGVGDIAIHSAKDLPYPIHPDLEIVALIPPFDQTDSLVSRDNTELKDLKKGVKIGTSSPQRKEQILERNPDLEIFSIRGTIEERIEQVDNGTVDALIVATCALKRLNLEHRIAEVLDFKTHPLQGLLAVTAKRNNLRAREIFSELDIRKSYGSVDLIGFGPGDPQLLTIKADRKLRGADKIFYDALIPEEFLENYPGEKIYVGKRKNAHSFHQDDICEQLYRSAIDGNNIVRLKGGDPFIFGRGGEEVDYLESRLLKVDTTPGITAAQGAGASINVPLTKRGISRELSLHTAHCGDLEPHSKTRVFYMGGTRLSEIQSKLLEEGFSKETTVLLVENATRDNQYEIKTTVEELDQQEPNLPVIVIAGDVSKEYSPQKYILNTGLRDKSYKLKGRVLHHPLIEIEHLDIDQNLDKYDAVIFTSITAVKHLTSHRDLKGKKIISIGPGTTRAIKKRGLEVDFEASHPDSDALYIDLKENTYRNILYPCSALSDNRLIQLRNVSAYPIYSTNLKVPETRADMNRVEGIIFTSPSTVDSFVNNYGEIPDIDIFCFGKFTRKRIDHYREGLNVQTIST